MQGMRVVKGGQDHLSWKINWSLQEIKSAFHIFTKKMAFFDMNLHNLVYLKSYGQNSLVRGLYHPSTSCSVRSKKKSKQPESWFWTD